mmetsp:Transcript_25175/g.42133  ORF Transcript_25175/g.42133 Transcript_25175/m.42133 type:complete len:206 (+) Transcript_25175:663-1280(+)
MKHSRSTFTRLSGLFAMLAACAAAAAPFSFLPFPMPPTNAPLPFPDPFPPAAPDAPDSPSQLPIFGGRPSRAGVDAGVESGLPPAAASAARLAASWHRVLQRSALRRSRLATRSHSSRSRSKSPRRCRNRSRSVCSAARHRFLLVATLTCARCFFSAMAAWTLRRSSCLSRCIWLCLSQYARYINRPAPASRMLTKLPALRAHSG